MTRVLIVNHAHSPVCGIYDIGVRLAHRLDELDGVKAVHATCDSAGAYRCAVMDQRPDFVIVNYRSDLTPWAVVPVPPPTAVVLHNYDRSNQATRANQLVGEGFDHVLALDLGFRLSGDARIHAVGRPLPQRPDHDPPPYFVTHSPWVRWPLVGSFGFAFPHKRFDLVAQEVADLGGLASYRLHMPEAYFNGAEGRPLHTDGILAAVRSHLGGHGLIHTADHVTAHRLVAKLADNDVNCLLYEPGQPDAGLSSALDYVIAARRPILVSEAAMFRHACPPVPTWPTTRLGDVINRWDEHRRDVVELAEQFEAGFRDGAHRMLERVL